MITLLGIESNYLYRSLFRYFNNSIPKFTESINLTFLINKNWIETRSIICDYRKNEIENTKGEITILNTIIILSFSDIKFNPGIKNIYHLIKISGIQSVFQLNIEPTKIKIKYAQTLWKEVCSNYIRKIIHDLRCKTPYQRQNELIYLEKILLKSEIEKIKTELK